jgi:hypothetical protein
VAEICVIDVGRNLTEQVAEIRSAQLVVVGVGGNVDVRGRTGRRGVEEDVRIEAEAGQATSRPSPAKR